MTKRSDCGKSSVLSWLGSFDAAYSGLIATDTVAVILNHPGKPPALPWDSTRLTFAAVEKTFETVLGVGEAKLWSGLRKCCTCSTIAMKRLTVLKAYEARTNQGAGFAGGI